ncbi:sugar phosphate nucleotidyltransferase [Schleiferiaceae bacterium]|jgi:glucose-1-phosphate thymidylyltransferase|nr:sugar phosphate nucleotidyltransferase [Schleiferiaceae bacterium]
MKIIVPMAGRGSRLRPHTLTVPKPLIPIAGKPIVQRLVEDIVSVCGDKKVDEIAFIIGDFGSEVEADLIKVAENLGAKGTIYFQDKPLGTAHAIHCAADSMDDEIVVAFADTLFRADFTLDTDADSVIWVKQVDNPSAYGVVQFAEDGTINNFVEKPKEFVSDSAIIGIYYFKDGPGLRKELKYILDNEILDNGEYQLTDALSALMNQGKVFRPGTVNDWMDCGNKAITVETNSKMLGYLEGKPELRGENIQMENAEIIEPCYIGNNVVLKNAKVGPNVSLGDGCVVENATIEGSLIQTHSTISNIHLKDSMIGNHAHADGRWTSVSLGDYSRMD